MKLYAPFAKVDSDARMVYGYASTEAVDSHGEVVTREALKSALPEFMRFGNIREMHQPSAVGRAEAAEIDAKGLYLGAHIVDDAAWTKVKAKVYNGFSIAGTITARAADDPKTITGVTLSEISLVDRPANPEAVFEMYKGDWSAPEPVNAAAGVGSAKLAKVGRRNSAADLEKIQAIHDQACALGADCAGGSAGDSAAFDTGDDADAAADAPDMAKSVAALSRAGAEIAGLANECRRLSARIEQLERQPAAPRGALRAIAKSDDLGDPQTQAAHNQQNTADLIKAALRQPRVF